MDKYENAFLREMAGRNYWPLFVQQGVSIVPDRKLVYVEASKCACTQVKTTLADIVSFPDPFDRSQSPHLKPNTGLQSVEQIGEEAVVAALQSSDHYRFTAVRNPFSRLVSAYNDKIANAIHIPGNHRYVPLARKMKATMIGATSESIDLRQDPVSFTEFMRYISLQDRFDMDRHWYPIVDSIWFDMIAYDRIVKTENLFTDMAAVLKDCGLDHISPDRTETANRVDRKKSVAQYYTPETLEIAKDLYAADFTAFDYDIDALDEEVLGSEHRYQGARFTAKDLPEAQRAAALDGPGSEITFIATGISREQPIYMLVESISQHLPEAFIHVAWQGTASEELHRLFADHPRAQLHEISEDAGLSAARNFLVRQIETPYFCLCDDDFVFHERAGLDMAAALLEAEPEIGIVGGRLTNYNYKSDGSLSGVNELVYAGRLGWDPTRGILSNISIETYKSTQYILGDETYALCDIVLNFAVMRTSLFQGSDPWLWDEDMKITGEHLDFYLSNLVAPRCKVAYLPRLHCDHHRVHTPEYTNLRRRRDGLAILFDKWGIQLENKIPGFVRQVTPSGFHDSKLATVTGHEVKHGKPAAPSVAREKRPTLGVILSPHDLTGVMRVMDLLGRTRIKTRHAFFGHEKKKTPDEGARILKRLHDKAADGRMGIVSDVFGGSQEFDVMMRHLSQENTRFFTLDRRDRWMVAAQLHARSRNLKKGAEAEADIDAILEIRDCLHRNVRRFDASLARHGIDSPRFYMGQSMSPILRKISNDMGFLLRKELIKDTTIPSWSGATVFRNWDSVQERVKTGTGISG